ncbi:MAG: BCCT family transporter [Acidobacteriota bacterium]
MTNRAPEIDRPIFWITLIVLVAVSIPLALAPERSSVIIDQLYDTLTHYFGVVYLWAGLAALVFLVTLALGRHGRVRLGAADEPPEFSTGSWTSMMFCAGVAAGLFYWGTIEWAHYFDAPPFGLEPGSAQAIEWVATYGIFHWGPTGWAIYCLPAVALSYAYFVRRRPYLRTSAACHGLLGARADGIPGRLIDLLFMVGMLGGAGTSLGLATPLVTAGIGHLTGLEDSFVLKMVVIVLVTLLFATSVYFGLERGIKRLSNMNTIAAFVILAFVLIAGPTLFILRMGTNSIGLVLTHFIRLNTWTDTLGRSGFVENWTVFYWAWWISFAPFMGIFVARISRGRTLRELIFGMIGYGSAGCAIFYVILGNYGLHLQIEGLLPVTEILRERGAPAAIAAIVSSLPWGRLVLGAFCLVATVFLATTFDSASYTLASSATRRLPIGGHPARWHRLFWAFALGVLPVALMFIGGLKALQTASLVVSLPLLIVGVIMAVSVVRSLREDERSRAARPGGTSG